MEKLTKSKIVETLQAAFKDYDFGKFKLLLYGSYAYGKPNNFSDIDILASTDDDFTIEEFVSIKEKILQILSEKNIDFGKKIDISVKKNDSHIKYVTDRWYLMDKLT